MGDIQSIEMKNGDIIVSLKISKEEYNLLKQMTEDLLLLPTSSVLLNDVLTTGKLGNSNRVMLPNKILRRHGIPKLQKKVNAKIFEIGPDRFLLIKLKETKKGVPVFKDGE